MYVADSSNTRLRAAVSRQIQDMVFLSESESGLELLPADPALDSQTAVARAIGAGGQASVMSGAAFVGLIRESTDAHDEGLTAYVCQWEELLALLESATEDICVYRYGSNPATIDIAAIVAGSALIIRTSAVET